MKTKRYKLVIDCSVEYDESIEEEEVQEHIIDSIHGNTMDRSDIVSKIQGYSFLDVPEMSRLDIEEITPTIGE